MAVASNFLDNSFPPANDSYPMEDVLYNMTQLARENKLAAEDKGDCIDAHNQQLLTSYSNVLVITKKVSDEMPLTYYQSVPTPRSGDSGNEPV
jgi:hypothetical protein